MLLEYFGDDRDGGVDGVRDHENKCLGGVLRNTGRKVANNTSVDLEEVVSVRRTLVYGRRIHAYNQYLVI